MEVLCKAGKLIISEKSVQVVAPFNRVVWNVQRSAIVGVDVKRGITSNTIEFRTAAGPFKAETVSKPNTQKILDEFN